MALSVISSMRVTGEWLDTARVQYSLTIGRRDHSPVALRQNEHTVNCDASTSVAGR